jgi:hypothetical protein
VVLNIVIDCPDEGQFSFGHIGMEEFIQVARVLGGLFEVRQTHDRHSLSLKLMNKLILSYQYETFIDPIGSNAFLCRPFSKVKFSFS